MELQIRRNIVLKDVVNFACTREASPPLTRVSVISVIENPFVDCYVDDLLPLIDASVGLAEHMVRAVSQACEGLEIQSYGKAGLVGVRGEQEHANALLTTAFATPFRDMIGDPIAWISSTTKIAGVGATIDVPLNNIHDVYVRSHYDTVSLCIPDAPLPDEIAVIFCMATRGRISARVGGLTHEQARSRRQGASL